MGLFQRLRDDRRRSKATQVKQEIANRLFINPLCSDYENVFAQVQPLINDMKMIRPFGVGKNGGRLPIQRTPEIALLDSPNDEMGWGEFAGAMFATWLTEDELNIHVHMERNKVRGYTIIPPGSKIYLGNGEYYFQINTGENYETLTRDEVMTLRFSRSPKNLQKGVSPATAVRAWAQAEDVLAQYERAYIQNGAIPASLTFIRASSYDKFTKVRKELENNLSGAQNHGKTVFLWRPYDNDTGESLDQVEVKTIQGNNSTLAIKELTDIINDHLNKAYGVSNFILGDDSSAKYDNAELSDYQFIKRRVYPALMSFWDQFQFELDRITGGLGYSIQFELELPDLTERQKVRAEIAALRKDTIIDLIQAGAPPLAAVKALGLGKEWQNVAMGIYGRVLVEPTYMDKQKISQNLPPVDNVSSQDETHPKLCSCDHRHSLQSSCGLTNTDALPPMTADEKKIYQALVAMAERIFANSPNIDAEGVIDEINDVLYKKAEIGATDGAKRVTRLLKNKAVVAEIKKSLENVSISKSLRNRIANRTADLVEAYGKTSKTLLENVLSNSKGLSASEIRKELRSLTAHTWQAERIARTETVYAFKSGRLDEDQRIADKYNLKMKLVWRTQDADACDVCAAMDGEETIVGEAFVDEKETPNGKVNWDQDKWNDGGRIPEAHPNCRCYFEEVIEEA